VFQDIQQTQFQNARLKQHMTAQNNQ